MNIRRGFTLIELLIVILILSILTAIAVPTYQNYVLKSKVRETQSSLMALSLSTEQFYQRTLSFPVLNLTSTTQLLANDTFKTWHPTSDAFNFQYVSTNGSSYTLIATALDPRLSGCTLSVDNTGLKTISNCGSVTAWGN